MLFLFYFFIKIYFFIIKYTVHIEKKNIIFYLILN